jgi:hypothetical protein
LASFLFDVFHFDFSTFILRCLRIAYSFLNHLSIGFKTLFSIGLVGVLSKITLCWFVPVKFLDKVNVISELLIACNNIEKNEIKQGAKTNCWT